MITWVLMTVRGRPELTKQSFECLRARTRSGDVRFVVVDNGSRDHTLDYLYETFRKGHIHRLICNKVQTVPQWEKSYAIQQAVNAVRMEDYDFFAWIDNDIEVKAGWLSAAATVLHKRPDIEVCSMHQDKIQEKHHPTLRQEDVGHVRVRIKRTANGALWVVRKSFFDTYGLPPVGFGINNDGTEDWYYGEMLQRCGRLFGVVEGFSQHKGYKVSAKKTAIRAKP